MGITVKWDNPEQTILRWDFEEHWDWSDFAQAQQQSNAFVSSVTYTVDIISDVTHSRGLPDGALVQFRNYRRTDPENTGRVVIVGASSFVKATVTMFRSLFPGTGGQFEFANSLDEARSLLLMAI